MHGAALNRLEVREGVYILYLMEGALGILKAGVVHKLVLVVVLNERHSVLANAFNDSQWVNLPICLEYHSSIKNTMRAIYNFPIDRCSGRLLLLLQCALLESYITPNGCRGNEPTPALQ